MLCLLAVLATPLHANVPTTLERAIEQCRAYLAGDVTPDRDEETYDTGAGPLTILYKDGEQCTILGAALQGETATLTWKDGVVPVRKIVKSLDWLNLTRMSGWSAPVVPVLACGAPSLVAQPLRVFLADAPFRDAAPDIRPIEINLPAPQALCDKYSALAPTGGHHA
ncbi:MAG: hypothetical protein AB8B82_17170 [Roseovarius sp.]